MGHIFLASRSDTNEIVDYTECTGENDEYYPLSPINRIETCEISASAPVGVYTQVSILSTFFSKSRIFCKISYTDIPLFIVCLICLNNYHNLEYHVARLLA